MGTVQGKPFSGDESVSQLLFVISKTSGEAVEQVFT